MAFSGLHVTCCYGGGRYSGSSTGGGEAFLPLQGPLEWSETLPTAATTTNVAPVISSQFGPPIFSVRSSVDAWVAVGLTPDASSGHRRFVAANTDYDFFVKAGVKLAWIAA